MAAVNQLKGHLDDPVVITALCSTALKRIGFDLRERIIAALKPVSREANRLFTLAATRSPSAAVRKRGFINLSLMVCTTAKSAVIQGLDDSNHEVRMAAALSIGLYHDQIFATAVERFFEKNRFRYFFAGIHELATHLPNGFKFRENKHLHANAMGVQRSV
jgi:HEAT repeat protein